MAHDSTAHNFMAAQADSLIAQYAAAKRAGMTPRTDLRMPAQSFKRTPSARGGYLLASVLTVAGTAVLCFVNFIA